MAREININNPLYFKNGIYEFCDIEAISYRDEDGRKRGFTRREAKKIVKSTKNFIENAFNADELIANDPKIIAVVQKMEEGLMLFEEFFPNILVEEDIDSICEMTEKSIEEF